MTETAADQKYDQEEREHPHQQAAAVAIAMMIGAITAAAKEQNQEDDKYEPKADSCRPGSNDPSGKL